MSNKSSAQLMQEWLVEAANELAGAHAVLDVQDVPRINPDPGGVEFTLAARIHYFALTATGQQEAVGRPSEDSAPVPQTEGECPDCEDGTLYDPDALPLAPTVPCPTCSGTGKEGEK